MFFHHFSKKIKNYDYMNYNIMDNTYPTCGDSLDSLDSVMINGLSGATTWDAFRNLARQFMRGKLDIEPCRKCLELL